MAHFKLLFASTLFFSAGSFAQEIRPDLQSEGAISFSNISVTNLTESSATVCWDSSHANLGALQYGIADLHNHLAELQTIDENGVEKTTHCLSISDLAAGTTYGYYVGESLGKSQSELQFFTTLELSESADLRPHVAVSATEDLASVLTKAKSWTIYDLASNATYTLAKTLSPKAQGIAIRGGTNTSIHYTGSGSVFSGNLTDIEFSDLLVYTDRKIFDQSGKLYQFQGPTKGDPWNSSAPGPRQTWTSNIKTTVNFVTAYTKASRILLKKITLRDLDGLLGSQGYGVSDVTVLNCQADVSERGDFIFFSGTRLLVDGVKAVNSWREHIIRTNGDGHTLGHIPQDITIQNSDIQNKTNYPGQQGLKEGIAIRDAYRVLIAGNTLRSWNRVGEGAGWEVNKPPVMNVTFRQNHFSGMAPGFNWVNAYQHTGGVILFDSNQFDAQTDGVSQQPLVGCGSPGNFSFRANQKLVGSGAKPKPFCTVYGDPLQHGSVAGINIQGLPASEISMAVPTGEPLADPSLPQLPALPKTSP